MPDARECAQLLLETLPNLMRNLGGAMRQCKSGEDDYLSMGQLRMLGMLQNAPRTLGELAGLHHVTPSTMSRTVDVLVRKAWVARQTDPNDRRQVILTLTPAGETAHAAMVQQTQDVFTHMIAQMIAQLDDDDRTRLYDGLIVLRKMLRTTGEELGEGAALP
jgi:DNA-binding MarR family transcriptional regulator